MKKTGKSKINISPELIPEIKRVLDYKEKNKDFSVYLCSPDYAPALKELEKYGLLKATLNPRTNKKKMTVEGMIHLLKGGKLRYKLENVKWELLSKLIQKRIPLNKLVFNQKLCSLEYNGEVYKPQIKGARARIFEELWKTRRIIDANGGIKKEGSFSDIGDLAEIGGLIKRSNDEDVFSSMGIKGTAHDRKVRDAIQDIRKGIKKINAPAEIITRNGFMLEETRR
ncbi:MAG: hypothetical protein Q8N88_01945 [Nanoarchaeota archaeon]|nr:hypothetical protein [Nanoarchaeota archaeon]